jgi:multicomponent Na+:H+ antiporter subunit F
MTIYFIAALGVLITMGLTLARACVGPSLYDRILAVNSAGTKTVLLIAVIGFLTNRPEFLDIAMVYALINFIGTIGVLKLFEHGDLGHSTRGTNVDKRGKQSNR